MMNQNHDELDLALVRYFSGQLSAAERADIERMHGDDLERLRALWEASGQTMLQPDVDAALRRMKAARAERARQPVLTFPQPTTRSTTTRVLRIAAAIAVLVTGGVLWRAADRTGAETQAVAMVEHRTERGQRRELRLADGTHVVLNVDSRIRIAADYGDRTRDVYVEGAAQFDVVHDERRPFRVHVGDAIAEDLGTRFSVRSYAGDRDVVVVVAEGRVEFKSTSQSAVLDPDQLARMDTNGAVHVTHGVDADELLAWSEGRLVFVDARLGDVVQQLNRWYDADVRLGDSALANLQLTASITDEPLTQVTDLIALSFDLRYERSAGTVTFYPKRNAR